MARSYIPTLLPLEEWARIMSVPGWHINQIEHPGRPARGACDLCWIQSGYYSDPNRIVGRDEVCQAIAEAEEMIARTCKFWPAPRWFCGDRSPYISWPDPARGIWVQDPALQTQWGYLIAAGVETWELLNLYPVSITYSDTDNDNIDDWATITFNLYLQELDECETVIVPYGRDPEQNWAIRPLQIAISGGVLTVQGPRWMFVDPEVWEETECPPLDDDTAFLTSVDVYRHYNYPYPAARVIWDPDPCATSPCVETYQDACIRILNERQGRFAVTPAGFAASTESWTRATYANCYSPKGVALWYYAGYRDPTCDSCETMSPALKRAIVSLANCYMADPPCGCDETLARWNRDREMVDMNTYNVAMAKSHFGTSMRGAVYAYSVINRIPPLGKGG